MEMSHHRAVAGRSVSVRKDISDKPMVMIPSIAKIMRHLCRVPKPGRLRIPDANRPPKAPAKGDMTMKRDSLKASSERRYQRDK